MGKLYKEAERVKLVLSANTECYAQVENLLEDIDFKMLVTREDLLNLLEDYLVPERITRPLIKGIILNTNIKILQNYILPIIQKFFLYFLIKL